VWFGQDQGLSFHFAEEAAAKAFLETLEKEPSAQQGLIRPAMNKQQNPEEFEHVFAGSSAREVYQQFSLGSMPIIERWMAMMSETGCESSALALDILLMQMFAVRRALARLSGATAEEPYPTGFLSLRSHAEGFFVLSLDAERSRLEMEQRYRKVADKLKERLRGFELITDPAAYPGLLHPWLEHLTVWMEQAYAEMSAGRLANAETGAGSNTYGKDLYASAFHRKLYRSRDFRRHLSTSLPPGSTALSSA